MRALKRIGFQSNEQENEEQYQGSLGSRGREREREREGRENRGKLKQRSGAYQARSRAGRENEQNIRARAAGRGRFTASEGAQLTRSILSCRAKLASRKLSLSASQSELGLVRFQFESRTK